MVKVSKKRFCRQSTFSKGVFVFSTKANSYHPDRFSDSPSSSVMIGIESVTEG